ncbi:MAG: hypothetical protein GY750_15595 [Lentisphaerae bacterium]|nr:hypothetical protein [Lentisphaerota bacterium]
MINETAIMKQEVMPCVQLANDLAIMDDQDNAAAADMLKQVKQVQKNVKAETGPAVKAAHESHKKVKALENKLINPLKEAEQIIKTKMAAFFEKQEQRRLAEAKAIQDTNPMQAVMTMAEVTTTQKIAGISSRKIWRARVADFAKLPDEFKLPDMAKLDKIAKATEGALPITGVEFYTETSIAARI